MRNIRDFAFFTTRRFSGYPLSIYPGFIKKILIYVIPFAFVNYFPAQYFLRKSDMVNYWSGFMYITPILGIILITAAGLVWKQSLKSYKSTGN